MALEMLEPRKGPGAIFTRKRLALVGGDVLLSRLPRGYFLFVHCEQQHWQLESVRQFRERSSGEEKLWGVGMRGATRDLHTLGCSAVVREINHNYVHGRR